MRILSSTAHGWVLAVTAFASLVAGSAAHAAEGGPGYVPGFPERMRVSVKAAEGAGVDVERLPTGIALAFALEPFRQHPGIVDQDPFVKRFAQQFDCQGYREAEDDEFASRKYVRTWRDNIRQALDGLPDPAGHRITVPIKMEFGRYDFERGGFPITRVHGPSDVAEIEIPGCRGEVYKGDTAAVVLSEDIAVDPLLPSSWEPFLETPEAQAKELVDGIDARVVTGRIEVEITGIDLGSGARAQLIEAVVDGPIAVSPKGRAGPEWTLEPPQIARLDGKACDSQPQTTRFRVTGADGMPYIGTQRSCKLARSDSVHTTSPQFEPAQPDPGIRYTPYRAGLVWIAQEPSLADSSAMDKIFREIIEKHKASYQGDVMYGANGWSIKPHIARDRLDLDSSSPERDLKRLEDDLADHLRKGAKKLPRTFVGAREIEDLDIDTGTGALRVPDGLLIPGEKQANGLIHYELGALDAGIYNPDVERTGPSWSGMPAIERLELKRRIDLSGVSVAPDKAKRLAQLERDHGQARAVISFEAERVRESENGPVLVGALRGVWLLFPDDQGGKWLPQDAPVARLFADASRTVHLEPSVFASIKAKVPPLEVRGTRPVAETAMNQIEDKQHMAVTFDRPVRLTEAGKSGDATSVSCNSMSDRTEMEPLPSEVRVQGGTLMLRVLEQGEVPQYASQCRFTVQPSAVVAAADGGKLEGPVEHKFALGSGNAQIYTSVDFKHFAQAGDSPDEEPAKLSRERAIEIAKHGYDNHEQLKGKYEFAKATDVRLVRKADDRFRAHIRYRYECIADSCPSDKATGYDQRIFDIERDDGKWQLVKIGKHMSGDP